MPETLSLSEALETVRAARTKYEVLGVPSTATESEVRVALRRLALLYHPDRHPEEDREIAHQIFREVSAAYRVLADAGERAAYDRSLAAGTEYRESSSADEGVSLRDILAELQRFEHVFSESKLVTVDVHLRDAVVTALIDDLGEQVVAVYPMKAAPSGAAMRGTYKVGAVVVTNLRVLLPYSYQWEEQEGNQKVRYTAWSMPSYPMPAVTRFRIEQKRGIVKAKTTIRIETEDRQTEVTPQEADLAKILIVARLWAIPVEAVETASAGADMRSALLGPLTTAALWIAGVLGVAAVIGIFAGGVADNPVWILTTGSEYGVWQVLVGICAIVSAVRLRRFIFTHRAVALTSLLPDRTSGDEEKPRANVAVA